MPMLSPHKYQFFNVLWSFFWGGMGLLYIRNSVITPRWSWITKCLFAYHFGFTWKNYLTLTLRHNHFSLCPYITMYTPTFDFTFSCSIWFYSLSYEITFLLVSIMLPSCLSTLKSQGCCAVACLCFECDFDTCGNILQFEAVIRL
jgi:hypothetical protein